MSAEPRLDPPIDHEPPPTCRECDDAGCPACDAEIADRLRPTIYRCGWCGHPTDADGDPIRENPHGYLARYPDAHEELVQGDCCPHGNEPEPRSMQVARDMAIDAGDRNLEGTWIEW